MSYPTLLAQQTASVLLALVPQAEQFTLHRMRKEAKTLPALTKPTLTIGTYDEGGSVTLSQTFDDDEEPRLNLSADGCRCLTAEEWHALRQHGDSVFRSTRHIDGEVIERADEIRRAWKMGVEAENTKDLAKAEKSTALLKLAEQPWTPKRDPQMALDFESEGEGEDRDQELERLKAEQMADAVENGEVIEDDPPVCPPDEPETEGPLAGVNKALAKAAADAGVVRPTRKRTGRSKVTEPQVYPESQPLTHSGGPGAVSGERLDFGSMNGYEIDSGASNGVSLTPGRGTFATPLAPRNPAADVTCDVDSAGEATPVSESAGTVA